MGCLVFVAGAFGSLPEAAAQKGKQKGKRLRNIEQPRREVQLPEGQGVDEGTTIETVRVTGNVRVDSETILDRAGIEAGTPLERGAISRAIHRVDNLDYFSDIRVDATRTPGGEVVVTFVVREKPTISEVLFEGNKEVDDEKIEEELTLEAHTILDVEKVKENVEKIRQVYVDKGYYLAEVDYTIEESDEAPGQVVVTYDIREYSKVQVKEITLLGNEAVPDRRLKRVMKTKEGNVLSIISNAGNFKQEEFERSVKRLTAYYYDQGYVDVDVGEPTIRLSKDKRFLFITLRIDEGLQYDVGEIDVKGDLLREREELLEKVSLESGETFSYSQMGQDAKSLKKIYQNEGYAFAQVQPLTRKRKDDQTVDVTFRFKRGEKVRIRRIAVEGNDKTRDKVVRRELELQEGDWYSNRAIEQSKRQVKRLGFFKNVEITTQRTSKPGYVDATVQVKERRTGNFQIGAGFSSTENFLFNAKISQNNLFGRGQSLSLQAQISAIRNMFNLKFTEPWLLDTRWQASMNLFNYQFAYQDFTRNSTGGDLTLGYPISEKFPFEVPGEVTARGTYKLEEVTVEPIGFRGRQQQRPGSFSRGGLTSSVTGELEYDTRNNRLFPTEGQLHTASVELADDALTQSENQFVRYDWESRVYIPTFWKFILRLNAEVGYVTSLTADEPVPLFERYLVGGPRTVRGFDRYTLGPSRFVASNAGDPGAALSAFNVGGNKQLIFKAELAFPILSAAGLKGVFFADAGNAFGEDQPMTLAVDLFEDPEEGYSDVLRTAVGAGIRWQGSPLGPLRFEWGFPLQRQRGEQPVVFEFSVGRGF